MAKKHMKRFSLSLTIGKIQIKTIMKYHQTLTRMSKMKKTDNTKCEDVEQQELPYIAGETGNWYNHYLAIPTKAEHNYTSPMTQQFHLQAYT